MKYKYTAEELFLLPEYQNSFRSDFGDIEKDISLKEKVEKGLAHTKNYTEGIFYHAGNGTGEAGLGNGLYLGKDKNALHYFYNLDGMLGNYMETYKGEPMFLDLTEPNSFMTFEYAAIKKYGKQTDKEHLRLAVLNSNFDGIRYFDSSATGEEFVLYNTSKVKLLSKEGCKVKNELHWF